jgi:archaellum component FlaC
VKTFEIHITVNDNVAQFHNVCEFILGIKTIQIESLDRIDSKLGYIEGNVQWLHKDVNYMKQEYSQEYYIDICKKVANNARN